MKTGTANLPLHGGRAPAWLFQRMRKLARAVSEAVLNEYGRDELLRRLSDPYWFQAFGCVLGFDWHSSGVTTTVCGALKEGLRGTENDLGVFVCGGKGRTSRRTPGEIEAYSMHHGTDGDGLVYASRMAAKVDSTLVQDGYDVYHHSFIFTVDGKWAVVQQGMNANAGYARRYHWLSDGMTSFSEEPHAAVAASRRHRVMNLVASESAPARSAIVDIARRPSETNLAELGSRELTMPRRHQLTLMDTRPDYLKQALDRIREHQPDEIEALIGMRGVGAKTVRALALVAELVYGVRASVRDPACFAYAHGGKDGTPFPVDRDAYDRTIEVMNRALREARMGRAERTKAMRRLALWREGGTHWRKDHLVERCDWHGGRDTGAS